MATEPARVTPEQLFGLAYGELISELLYNLRERDEEPVPVYPFVYDWRQPLAATETQLEVVSRHGGRELATPVQPET